MAKVLTLEEVAEYLHVHPSSVYRLLKNRRIPAFRMGSDWRFNQESIEQWVKKLEDGQPAL
jgi:excisionase family DNA binding protein